MKEQKEELGWLSSQEYGGYMNAIHAGKDDEYLDKIEAMTPEQIDKWLSKKYENGQWVTTVVFDAIAKKLKPIHEAFLLSEMDKVTIGRIESWVKCRKREGYFFSDLAYQKAEKILNGEIENRKIRIPKRKKKDNEEMPPPSQNP